jgi:hypothetical protein
MKHSLVRTFEVAGSARKVHFEWRQSRISKTDVCATVDPTAISEGAPESLRSRPQLENSAYFRSLLMLSAWNAATSKSKSTFVFCMTKVCVLNEHTPAVGDKTA